MPDTNATRSGTPTIRPFTIEIPEADLEDLRARIAATRWPEKETVEDTSQGVQLATIQAVARYWATSTTGASARRSSTPCRTSSPRSTGWTSTSSTFARSTRTRCRSSSCHGWPGSIIEQLKIVDPLTDPTAHGGERRGRLRRGDPLDAGLRVLGQADRRPGGTRSAWRAPGSC